ncbi:MAG: hypothetical protein Q8L88_05650 [Bacteroidota bacterium]|nr:hypothetical protein [Bacteroidota bacterium]
MNNEFILYDRIVNGNLRPHLERFSTPVGLKELEKEFYSKTIIIQNDNIGSLFDEFINDFHGIKDGDKLEIEISDDDATPQIVLRPILNSEEESLINIDIPPPPNEKAEIFLRIIENEYNRIETSLTKNLTSLNNENDIKIYGLKNIQIAKKIARDSHLLGKKIEKIGVESWDNPNTYIIYVLKKHLIYSLLIMQNIYCPLIGQKIQTEGELEDELFDCQHSIAISKAASLSDFINVRHIEKLYNEIAKSATLEEKINLFKNKVIEQMQSITKKSKSKYGVVKFEYDLKKLYQKELGKLLSEYYYRKLISESKEIGIVKKYEQIIKTITKLKINHASIEGQALESSDFFSKMELEKELLKELMDISLSIPKPENICKDLISLLVVMQTRKHSFRNENQLNDYLCDLLRVKGYYVADQSRSGRSGSDNVENYESGELDISIRDITNNGVIKTIIESLEIDSCGDGNNVIKSHIGKLLSRYDTAGNEENYVIVYSKASDFNALWIKYKNHIDRFIFQGVKNVEDIEVEQISKSNIKVGKSYIEKEGKQLKLYHLFVDMKK